MQTLSRNIDQAFALLKLALNDARFDADAIERVRGQLAAGIKRDANDPDAMVAKAFREAAFPGHPYSRPTRGELDRWSGDALRPRGDARPPVRARQSRITVIGAIDAATLAARLDELLAAGPSAAISRRGAT